MNSLERVQAAFDGTRVDTVPVHHIGFSSSVASALLGREAYVGGGIQQWREAVALWQGEEAHQEFLERSFRDAIDVALLCDHDIIRAGYWRYNVKPTRRVDEYTFLYEYGDEEDWRVLRYDPGSEQCHIFDYKPKGEITLERLEEQVAAREKAAEGYHPQEDDFAFEIRAQRLLGHERAIRVGGVGIGIPHETAWLEATALRPDLVARLLDAQVEIAERNVRFLAPLGFRYFFGGSDLASNDGPMYSPRVFHELVLPRLRRVSDVCHQYGAYHLFASDGNLWPIAEDLFGRSGVDGYYEIDRRAGMDLRKLRQRFPRLTLLGNISSHTVHMGTKEEVVAETLSCLEEAKECGGVIVGCSNYFVPHTPVDNVLAVLETIRQYR
ncbi:MAG: hypothetical protein J7M34_09560 [Anaerolineae bacterium]|nr:hypothetical protein [Anaerolineae bacterium]